MQRLRPAGCAGRCCSALLVLGVVSLVCLPVLQVAAEPSFSPFSNLAASFRSYLPSWGQPIQHRRLQQADEPDQSSTTCAELQYTCSDPNSADSGCGELCALTFTISAPLYQLISNGSCTDLDADLGLWRCGQNLVQASTVNLVNSSQCVETCKEPSGASKSCSAPPAPAPSPIQPPVSAPAPTQLTPTPTLAAAPAPMTPTGPAVTVVAVPAPAPSSSMTPSPTPLPTPASTSPSLQGKVLDAFVNAPPRMLASPPPPPSVSCFDGPVVTATTLICGLTAASLNATQLEAAISASLLYNNATYTTIILGSSTTDASGPGCAANSTGSSQITAATTSCTAAATSVIVVAPTVDAAYYIQQVLASFPQNIAVGLPSSTALGPVCVKYQTAPGTSFTCKHMSQANLAFHLLKPLFYPLVSSGTSSMSVYITRYFCITVLDRATALTQLSQCLLGHQNLTDPVCLCSCTNTTHSG